MSHTPSDPAPAGTPDADPELHSALRLLRACGAEDMDHPGGTLLAHLLRVRQRLAVWEARPALQLAGLCHAFYGTDGFAQALLPLERRPELAEAIGAEAEAIVHFYGACDRKVSYRELGTYRNRFTGRTRDATPREQRDLAELTAANELDIALADEEFRLRHGADLLELFTRMRPALSPAAWRETAKVLGDTA
ncbi:DUF6817 domain-containing protein [Streptomyces indicus]|uniref:DUF6817 domain-containing protein n=1 Tax=Streptomyces indicus TaxID=417292 RepID=A0A1G9BY21_9ACTN|nr:hypothetical protein [Streptomyces indicus]SDK44074.1 hypothetical protein SAMN05421806_107294 [Streptomyces indicus]